MRYLSITINRLVILQYIFEENFFFFLKTYNLTHREIIFRENVPYMRQKKTPIYGIFKKKPFLKPHFLCTEILGEKFYID